MWGQRETTVIISVSLPAVYQQRFTGASQSVDVHDKIGEMIGVLRLACSIREGRQGEGGGGGGGRWKKKCRQAASQPSVNPLSGGGHVKFVMLWTELGDKLKWLPLIFGHHDMMYTVPIQIQNCHVALNKLHISPQSIFHRLKFV